MDAISYLAFILISAGLIIVPGPNVLVIVSTSMTHGVTRGLQALAGTSTAMILQLTIAALGTGWIVESLTQGFLVLKWAGVAYLVYLGLSNLQRLGRTDDGTPEASASASFARGFLVSLTNPKTILFFGAFLPQFVTADGQYWPQIAMLSTTFFLLAVFFDGIYAVLAGRIHRVFLTRNLRKLQYGGSGLLYLLTGAWIATMRRA